MRGNEAAWITAVLAAFKLEARDRVDLIAFLMARDPRWIADSLEATARYLRLEADALAKGERQKRAATHGLRVIHGRVTART
jgi:hypothetical protein